MADENLTAALAGLSRLVTGQGRLEDTLRRVSEFAVQAIPGADGAGLTLVRGDRLESVPVSTDFVRAVEDVQYGLGEGPCITAVRQRRTVRVGSLGGDPQWPRFAPRVGRMGVRSALSTPLLVDDELVGVLNVYARNKDAFGPDAARLAELFAHPAAVTVANACAHHDLQLTVRQLNDALTSRATIDQAVGLLMARSGASADEAFDRLRDMSQRRNTKLAVVAQRLLDEAVGRARARRARADG